MAGIIKRNYLKILLVVLIPLLLTFGGAKYIPVPTWKMEQANAAFSAHRLLMATAGVSTGGDVTAYAFDGASYLSIPDHADWSLGSNDFTLEYWVKFNEYPAGERGAVIDQYLSTGDKRSFIAHVSGDGSSTLFHTFVYSTDGTAGTLTTLQGDDIFADVTLGQWHHIVFELETTTLTYFLDGVTKGTDALSATLYSSDQPLLIGRNGGAGGSYFNGFMDEIRLSDNARYGGSGFTPATTEFVSDANTLLLIHSGEAYTGALTDETVQSVYSFNGTSDTYFAPDDAGWDVFGSATGDYTVSMFVKYASTPSGTDYFMTQRKDANNLWFFGHDSTNGLTVTLKSGGSDILTFNSGSSDISDLLWHHVALIKVDDDYGCYLDGNQVASLVGDSSTDTFAGTLTIASNGANSPWFGGEITEVLVQASNIFSGAPAGGSDTITVPTSRHTSDANTKLLVHGDEWKSGASGSAATFTESGNSGLTVTEISGAIAQNGGTFNDSGNTTHVVTEVGNAYRETEAGYKFSTDGVGYLIPSDGSYLSTPDHANWTFSADFTIELWVKWISFAASDDNAMTLFAQDASSQRGWNMFLTGGGDGVARVSAGVYKNDLSTYQSSNGGNILVPRGVWTHIALTCDSDVMKLWINGVQDTAYSLTLTERGSAAAALWIGRREIDAGRNYIGFMDDLRISDTARYTTGFTPHTSQHSDDGNTLLLIRCGETKSGTTGSGATFTDTSGVHTVTEVGASIEATENLYKH